MKYSLFILSGILTFSCATLNTQAYFTPEEVLLSNDYFLPPSPRETEDIVAAQEARSESQKAAALQQALQDLKNAAPEDPTETVENEPETSPTSLLENLSEEDLALLETIRLLSSREQRLLDRVNANQYSMNQPNLHSGAPPLAPTGAGGILTAITMIGAVIWTIWQVKHAQNAVTMGEEERE